MSTLLRCVVASVLFSLPPSAQLALAQDKPSTASPIPSNFPAEYPNDGASVLVENSSWVDLSAEFPSKIRTKRGLAASLSFGAVRAAVIAEYAGQRAGLRIQTRRPVFCICNAPSIPGGPVLVKLHLKRDSRELDGAGYPSWEPRSPRRSSLLRFRQKQYNRKMLVGSCARAKTSRPVSML